jgi:hypothetical protein
VNAGGQQVRERRLNKWLVLGTVPVVVAMGAVPAGVAVAAAQPGGAARGAEHNYILILRNQNSGLGARSQARKSAVRSEQRPVLARVRSLGGKVVGTTSLVNAVIVKASASGATALAASPAVAEVVPDAVIAGPTPLSVAGPTGSAKAASPASTPGLCGTASNPQLNPEALFNIHAEHPQPGADGAGVKVALLADGLNPADPDFQRNAAFASAGSPAGSPVVTEEDFSSDGVNAPTAGGEAFLDASSIAAQANTAYDLNQFVSTVHQLPSSPCDIKIQGVAPGASVLALKVFAQDNDTTTSGFLQAINYAVASGVKVINESFGSNNFPDLTADAIRQADDAAVKAGVTVVVSTGDGGITSTIGSPATDPNVISVGASTTFRLYEQDTLGGVNDPNANGRYVDNNISSLSSGGVSQAGGTVDLVAPGDYNWALCDSDITLFSDCTNENGTGSPIQATGGTSEAAPLTSGAAADVIQAYAATHAGTDPSPALVKQILMSTATDIDAPATQQGAGLLNVAAAIRLARSVHAGSASGGGGLLVSPGQIDVSQQPGASSAKTISVTNTSSHSVKVSLATRALTKQVGNDSGSFCIQPGTPTASCPANTGVFPIWSGVDEVYQDVKFTVAATTRPSRLSFSADYQYTGQSSLLHVALLEPDGTYAGYSLPQGLADYANIQVANPPAGTWTAVFFTEQNGATTGGIGTSGPVQWDASTAQYAPASPISPATLSLGAGQTGSAKLTVTSPSAAGDTSESVVISGRSQQTTIPVVIRTVIPTTASGGSFRGVLTGGNGRASTQAQANDYVLNVPKGSKAIHATITLANDPADLVIAQLIAPDGQNLGYSSNVTYDAKGQPESTNSVDLYHANPQAGNWTLILQWQNPVSGNEISEPFSGSIHFGTQPIYAKLPHGRSLKKGTYTYKVTVHNSGRSPEAYFVDTRLHGSETITLPNLNSGVNAASMTLPLPATSKSGGNPFPYYAVPALTTQLHESLTGTAPVDFDSEYFPGDPDLEGAQSGDSASLSFSSSQIAPGLWLLNPAEIGPFPAAGAPAVSASATVTAVTQAFDPAVTSSTGDLWSYLSGLTGTFAPVYVPAGGTRTITVKIAVSGAAGSAHGGVLYVDDVDLAGLNGLFSLPNGDTLTSLPFSYTVAK